MAPSRTDRQSRKAASSEKPPRPPNAWILYRTARLKQIRSYQKEGQPPLKQADISRTIGDMWKAEPDHVRKQFEKEAEIAKAKHAEQYPNYKYKP
ncbi:high mobility group box domain-containing protein, partial [Trametes punicea]